MKLERIVKRFYDELENGKIMGRKCQACGAVEFPPKPACTTCGHFEMDWIEMSGKGVVEHIVMPSPMTPSRNDVFKPYALGCVTMEEGPKVNLIVRGIRPEDEEEIIAKLPLPVKACTFQRDGFKIVVTDLVIG